jgi:hypothetical protein
MMSAQLRLYRKLLRTVNTSELPPAARAHRKLPLAHPALTLLQRSATTS